MSWPLRVNEALLEMLFFRPLVDLFQQQFGARFLRLIKPSQRREVLVGFDEGWVRTETTEENFMEQLGRAIQLGGPRPTFHVAYFLQFKVVEEMIGRSAYTPDGYDLPYYRSEIDLEPSPTTGLSQHETLVRLCRIAGADVSYACPMVFDPVDAYAPPSLDNLRIVPVDGAPAAWLQENPRQRHFIAFQRTDAPADWCSTPIRARATLPPQDWLSNANPRRPRQMGPAELRDLVQRARALSGERLPGSLTVLEFAAGDLPAQHHQEERHPAG